MLRSAGIWGCHGADPRTEQRESHRQLSMTLRPGNAHGTAPEK
jgi:hypothetical protein